MSQTFSLSDTKTRHVVTSDRAGFVRKVYGHLFGAIILFTILEIILFQTGLIVPVASILGSSWLLTLGGFILLSWLATRAAQRANSLSSQYLALGGFVLLEALIFAPLLLFVTMAAQDFSVLTHAIYLTLGGFAFLTAIVMFTKRDFTFLRGILTWAGILALITIVAAIIFNLTLGYWFALAMIALAGASILYDTSKILKNYPEDRYVAASLDLFASVALLFWYVLRLLSSR